MILAFGMVVILFGFLLFTKKKLLRRHWLMLFLFGFVFALLVAFVSVLSAWNPYASSLALHDGNYSGASALSYPLQMSVYMTPAAQRTLQEYPRLMGQVEGNVSFAVFITNQKMLETNGTFNYAAIFGPAHVYYQLEFPYFSDGPSFFVFLLITFTLSNMTGVALGLILAHGVSRYLHYRSMLQ